MKAVLTIEVPDDFMHARWTESWEGGPPSAASPVAYFRGRLEDVADDELRVALWGWPITTTVTVE